MSEIQQELAKVQQNAQEQTAASNSLVQEVSGKMAAIDEKVAESQRKLDELVSGDFVVNVNAAKSVKVFIDPVDGDDSNTGLDSVHCIKSSARMKSLVSHDYDHIRLVVKNGTVFDLIHYINAKRSIVIESWAPNGGSSEKPEIRQAVSTYANLVAPYVYLTNVIVSTYAASANETLPDVYKNRSIFGSQSKLRLIFSELRIHDNQLYHIHDAGSGDDFHRRSISFYQSKIKVLASADGVTGSQKKVFSRFGSTIAPPLDLFGVVFTMELNGQQANLRSLLAIPDTYIITNLNLDMV